MSKEYNIIAFYSTHDAMKAESVLIGAGLIIKLIPTPSEISAGCGFSVKVLKEELEKAKEILINENIEGKYY